MLLAQLTARVAPALCEWYGSGSALVSSKPNVRRLKQSFFIRYSIRAADGSPATLLIKIPRKPDIATLDQAIAATHLYAATQREYDSLLAVANAFADACQSHFCIRPFAYLPDWNAIAMQELPTRSFKQMQLKLGMTLGFQRDWKLFLEALTHASEWLKIFHSRLGDLQIEPLDTRELLREINVELARLDRATNHALDVTSLRDAFAALVARVHDVRVPVTTLHGDFNCGNILITRDGRVGAIDTKRRQRGPIYIDLAALITDPATRKLQVLSRGAFIRQNQLDQYGMAVLKGYFGSEAPDMQILHLYSALAALRKWTLDEEMLANASGFKKIAAVFATAQVRDYFRQLLSRYLTSAQGVR